MCVYINEFVVRFCCHFYWNEERKMKQTHEEIEEEKSIELKLSEATIKKNYDRNTIRWTKRKRETPIFFMPVKWMELLIF